VIALFIIPTFQEPWSRLNGGWFASKSGRVSSSWMPQMINIKFMCFLFGVFEFVLITRNSFAAETWLSTPSSEF